MRLVIVSCAPDEAERLLDSLLEERLVGCGNILPSVRSHYWWQGAIQRDTESLLLMGTGEDRIPALMEAIQRLHSYEVPKVISLEISEALPAYAAWLGAVIAGA